MERLDMAGYIFKFSSSSLFSGWYDRERDKITIILHPDLSPSKLVAGKKEVVEFELFGM
jgi:hypothetical protein